MAAVKWAGQGLVGPGRSLGVSLSAHKTTLQIVIVLLPQGKLWTSGSDRFTWTTVTFHWGEKHVHFPWISMNCVFVYALWFFVCDKNVICFVNFIIKLWLQHISISMPQQQHYIMSVWIESAVPKEPQEMLWCDAAVVMNLGNSVQRWILLHGRCIMFQGVFATTKQMCGDM